MQFFYQFRNANHIISIIQSFTNNFLINPFVLNCHEDACVNSRTNYYCQRFFFLFGDHARRLKSDSIFSRVAFSSSRISPTDSALVSDLLQSLGYLINDPFIPLLRSCSLLFDRVCEKRLWEEIFKQTSVLSQRSFICTISTVSLLKKQ